MKSLILVLGVTLFAAPVQADITHKIQSSVSLSVDGAGSVAIRQPSSLAISGNNVTLDTASKFTSFSSGTALGYTPGAYSITTAGDAFSYSESYKEGDVPAVLSTTVTSGVVPALPVFGNTTTTSGGHAATLAGTLATDGAMSITAGGAGTQAISQLIQELTIK